MSSMTSMSSMTLAPIYHEVTRLTAFNFLGQLEAFWDKLGQTGANWAKSKTSTRYTESAGTSRIIQTLALQRYNSNYESVSKFIVSPSSLPNFARERDRLILRADRTDALYFRSYFLKPTDSSDQLTLITLRLTTT